MAVERKYCVVCDGEGYVYDSENTSRTCHECEGNRYEWVIIEEDN